MAAAYAPLVNADTSQRRPGVSYAYEWWPNPANKACPSWYKARYTGHESINMEGLARVENNSCSRYSLVAGLGFVGGIALTIVDLAEGDWLRILGGVIAFLSLVACGYICHHENAKSRARLDALVVKNVNERLDRARNLIHNAPLV